MAKKQKTPPVVVNRRNLDPLSTLFMATGDPALTAIAESRSKARRGRNLMNLGQGVIFDPETGTARVPEAYRQQIEARNQALIERMERSLAGRRELAQQQAMRVPESTAQKAAKMQTEQQIGSDLLSRYQTAVKEGEQIIEPIAGIPAALARGAGFPGVAASYERLTDTPTAIQLRSDISDFVGPYRQARFGANLTGGEIAEWQKVDPLASGISEQESMNRLKRISDWYGRHAGALTAGRQLPGTQSAPAPTGLQRPPGVSDEAWAAWLAEQGGQ